MIKVAAAQAGSILFDTPSTMARIESLCREAALGGAKLLVLPEGMLGGYPKGWTFGASVGNRTVEGREQFRMYMDAAVGCPGPETEMIAVWARELDLHIVIGIIERDGGTLYCTGLVFAPGRGLILKHRKLMPTASERLIWGLGDGSTMQVASTDLGRIGVAICWENYMPLYRQHLYNQHVEIWCAPTVDQREMWQVTMRHIAYEGRCFVVSACQFLTKADWPENLRAAGGEIDGRSLIVSPFGDVLTGSKQGAGLLYADLDPGDIARGKFDLDVAGHYNRPDVFEFHAK